MFGHHAAILIAPPQNAAMHLGMQGFYPPIHHFRKAGVIRHFNGRNALVFQQLVSAAGGQDFNAQLVQGLGKFHNAGFVGNADQGALDGFAHGVIRLVVNPGRC